MDQTSLTATSKRLLSSLILSLVMITSACGSSMKSPDIKLNPHPKMRYEITMTIQGAPRPFDEISGFVQYKVSNDRCVPLTPISGATLPPEKSVPLELLHVSDNVYKGTIYVDLLQDEAYYGLGVCHWAVVAATASLKLRKVDFSPDLLVDNILKQASETRYFSKKQFEAADRGESAPPVISGVLPAEYKNLKPEWRQDMFPVILSAKKDFQ
ncbi:hypothetical protein ACPPVV_03670 [Rhodanobacter sp. Col0626]|uniref:hypothetical protein n=1 Tax=Rhodanobacter sp. Col0626 TaxID=3415679 RepID=UPI003CFB1DBC